MANLPAISSEKIRVLGKTRVFECRLALTTKTFLSVIIRVTDKIPAVTTLIPRLEQMHALETMPALKTCKLPFGMDVVSRGKTGTRKCAPTNRTQSLDATAKPPTRCRIGPNLHQILLASHSSHSRLRLASRDFLSIRGFGRQIFQGLAKT